jgi:SAM-dependent methyltransferase
VNLDIAPSAPEVRQHDLSRPLPFRDGSFDAVYHSHVLEHLAHAQALPFLRECHRVLARGAVLRAVVPDLEAIARLYLRYLDGALAGDPEAAKRYEWMVLELLDQMVRERSGGEMLAYWRQNPMPAEDFVIQRAGQEVRQFLKAVRRGGEAAAVPAAEPGGETPPSTAGGTPAATRGEVHKWMYDRYSLGRLLEDAGFTEVKLCAANESRIPEFSRYELDADAQGSPRKPDSLFMEAIKP